MTEIQPADVYRAVHENRAVTYAVGGMVAVLFVAGMLVLAWGSGSSAGSSGCSS